jgi:hypothetical protein
MTDPGYRAEAQDHLLIDVQNRNEEDERPEKRGTVILASLGVGAKCAGIVVAHHHDQAGRMIASKV